LPVASGGNGLAEQAGRPASRHSIGRRWLRTVYRRRGGELIGASRRFNSHIPSALCPDRRQRLQQLDILQTVDIRQSA